jgi:hypothetical protein
MKKYLILFSILTLFVNIYPAEYTKKDFKDFRLKMKIPNTLNAMDSGGYYDIYFADESGNLEFIFNCTDYSESKADFSEYSEDNQQTILEFAQSDVENAYYAFNIKFDKCEFIELNDRTCLTLNYSGVLSDKYKSDTLYADYIQAVEYQILKYGLLYNFVVVKYYSEFDKEELKIVNEMLESIVLY